MSSGLRVPPQNIDAEKALIGSIMVRPVALNDIIDIIFPESFYVEKHRLIYQGMLELARKSEPIDLVSLSSKLREQAVLETIGGMAYLSELVSLVPASTNIEHYAHIVARKSTLRKLIAAGDTITQLGFDEGSELDEIMDQAEQSIMEITSNAGQGKKFVGIKEILPKSWESMEKLHEHTGEFRGAPTGFRDLDLKLSGLQKADLIILAARPSMGKTSLALDIARQSALGHGVPVGIFSLEMGSQSLVDRMLAAEAKVDSWKMRTGKGLTEDDFMRVRDAMERLSKAPIYIDDASSTNLLKMRATARRLKTEHGLGLIIVDYLQLITTTKNYDSMVNQVTEISRSLKGLARELDVPVLALSQLSRAVESRGGRPRLSDLRDSGAIEQDADVVMFIHREDKNNQESDRPNIAEILIEKHRNGPTGVVELFFDDTKTTFLTIEKNDFGDFAQAAVSAHDEAF